MAKDSVAISISHLNPCRTPDTKGFRAGVLPLQQPVGLGRSRWGGREIYPSGSPPGSEDLHGLAVLFGVQADFEVGLHLQPEGFLVEVEGAASEELARPGAGRWQRQEPLDRLVEGAGELGGGHHTVDPAQTLRTPGART